MSVGRSLVIDTNVLVSAGLWPHSVPGQVVSWAIESKMPWALCEESMAELNRVLMRPKFDAQVPLSQRSAFIDFVRRHGKFVELNSDHMATAQGACRDPGDELFLALALAAQATTIVSGDADLITLHPWRGIAICTAAAYIAEQQINPK